jgi:uncharacterized protein YkvS
MMRSLRSEGINILSYGVKEIENSPSIIKNIDIGEIVDKKENIKLGYYISAKYENYLRPIIEKIDKEEKIKKLKILKKYQDLEFTEVGVDDGL